MKLGEKQELFAFMLTILLIEIHGKGYSVRLGAAHVCDDCKRHHRNSLHKLKLAQDINLFKDGTYLTKTSDHLYFGEYWEGLGGSWGGRFSDGNHYSLAHNGMR